MQTYTPKQFSDGGEREKESNITNLVDNNITKFAGRWLLDKFTDTHKIS